MKRRQVFRNLKLSVLLLAFPIGIGIFVGWYIFSNSFSQQLAVRGAQRLTTENWQLAEAEFEANKPEFERKYAYYRVKENQSLPVLAERFGTSTETLAQLNPGTIVTGTTIKVPPLERPYTPLLDYNTTFSQLRIFELDGALHIKNDFKLARVNINMAGLATILQPYNILHETSEGIWRLDRSISLDENIRLDITAPEVTRLELTSNPNFDITCLCLEDSEVLIKGVTVTSIDRATNEPDATFEDGRAFIRALKSSRLDVIDSRIEYLGNELLHGVRPDILKDGGTYGISWRIPDTGLGVELVTGWVEGSTFYKNHYGSYTFGASGMMWRGNHYLENDVYGLDPHDDSNNAMVEDNLFEKNGKHGFIVSKRCNYNIIRNNRSIDNVLHGYMLHQDSVYNVMENNYASNNGDNYVVYASDFNMIKGNQSENARNSHVRINQESANNFVYNNTFSGGKRGVYAYGGSKNIIITNNTFKNVRDVLVTQSATNVLFANNTIPSLQIKIGAGDRVIFGPNTVTPESNEQ